MPARWRSWDAHPDSKGNPFFLALPHALLIPIVILATLATIIASQAIITGVFTLTRQAMQLGWFPGLNIRQTSDTDYGQIYVPGVNWVMMVATIAIAVGFGSSDRLSGAYGTAVSTTMLMTTALIYDVMRRRWGWGAATALPIALGLFVVDLAFFGANLLKISDGGYVPLAIAVVLFVIMVSWHRGIQSIRERLTPLPERTEAILGQLRRNEIVRVPGSIAFLSRAETPVPPIMARYITDFHSLPEKVIVLEVMFSEEARVARVDRIGTHGVQDGIWQVTTKFGFVEVPNLVEALAEAQNVGCDVDLDEVLYIVAQDDVVPHSGRPRMWPWQRVIFAFMFRNAVKASDRFALPRDRLVEIGHQVAV